MSKTHQNIAKSKRGGYDLFGRRPKSRSPLNPFNKKICRRIERRRKGEDILLEIENWGD